MNFDVLWLYAKVFSVKIGGIASFGMEQFAKLFAAKIVDLTNLRKFSPLKVFLESFPLYGTRVVLVDYPPAEYFLCAVQKLE